MPATLYYYPYSPPVRAVLLVAKAVGLQLDLKHVDMLKGENRKPDFLEGPVIKEGQEPDPAKLHLVLEALTFLNTFLEGQQWVVCNQKTIADYAIAVTISNAEVLGFDLKKYPNIVSWFANVQTAFIDYEELNGNPAKKLGEYFNSKIVKKA